MTKQHNNNSNNIVKKNNTGGIIKNKYGKKKAKKNDDESRKFDYADEDFRTKEIVNRIKFLQNLIDNFIQKTEKSKVAIADLEKQMKVLDEAHKTNYKGATETSLQNAKCESRRVIGRIVHKLENGLNTMLQKKGAEEQFQQTQKRLIDDYRIERKGLIENTNLLEKKLRKDKLTLRKVMRSVNNVQLTRLATDEHMKNLKSQIAETEKRFEIDWTQLDEIIDLERKKTHDLQLQKNNELTWFWDRHETGKRIDKRDLKKRKALQQARVQTNEMMEGKKKFEQAKERALRFEERVTEIKKKLMLKNMAEMIQTFSKREKNIFSLMEHINGLTAEAELLEAHVRENKEEVEKLSGASKKRSEIREELMRNLKIRAELVHQSINITDAKTKSASNLILHLQSSLKQTFDEIECTENIPAASQLSKVDVTDSSMMSFLGVIQQRTNQVLTMYEHFYNDDIMSSTNGSASNTLSSTNNKKLLSSRRKPGSPRKTSGISVRVNKVALLDEKLEKIINEQSTNKLLMGSTTGNVISGNKATASTPVTSSLLGISPNPLKFLNQQQDTLSTIPVRANAMRELIKEKGNDDINNLPL
jgi:coiled-coil domain-containing protein 63/114